MVIEEFEKKQVGSPAVSKAVFVSEKRPALPTASSKLTHSDSYPPTTDRGPPTDRISHSPSASLPSSSTRLPASSLTTVSCTLGRSGGTDH